MRGAGCPVGREGEKAAGKEQLPLNPLPRGPGNMGGGVVPDRSLGPGDPY